LGNCGFPDRSSGTPITSVTPIKASRQSSISV